jgi:hypothetical protein
VDSANGMPFLSSYGGVACWALRDLSIMEVWWDDWTESFGGKYTTIFFSSISNKVNGSTRQTEKTL